MAHKTIGYIGTLGEGCTPVESDCSDQTCTPVTCDNLTGCGNGSLTDADFELSLGGFYSIDCPDGTCESLNGTFLFSAPQLTNGCVCYSMQSGTGSLCIGDGFTYAYDLWEPGCNVGSGGSADHWVVNAYAIFATTPSKTITYRLTGAAADQAMKDLCAGKLVTIPYFSGDMTNPLHPDFCGVSTSNPATLQAIF